MTPDPLAPDLPVVDRRILGNLQALDDDDGFVAELAEVFLTESPVRSAALADGARAGRVAELVSMAHAFKGAARTLGLARVAAVCQEIESGAKEGRVPAAALLARLDVEVRAAGAELQPLRRPGGGHG